MTTPTIPDDIFEQVQLIDKDLSSAMACLALGHVREMLEKLHRAQARSHSLNFRLEADRLPPGSVRPIFTLYTTPETAL